MMNHEKRGRTKNRAPRGHFVVYVGAEKKRYTVPLSHLKTPSFKLLLQKAADEYGFHIQQGIVLPCDEATFLMALDSPHLPSQ